MIKPFSEMPDSMTCDSQYNAYDSISKYFIDIERHEFGVELPSNCKFGGTTWYEWIRELYTTYYESTGEFSIADADRDCESIEPEFRCRSCGFQKRSGEETMIRGLERVRLREGVVFPIIHRGVKIDKLPNVLDLGSTCVLDHKGLTKNISMSKRRNEQLRWLREKWNDGEYRALWATDGIQNWLRRNMGPIKNRLLHGSLSVNDIEFIIKNLFFESNNTDKPIRLYKGISSDIPQTNQVFKFIAGKKVRSFHPDVTYHKDYIEIPSQQLEKILLFTKKV